ncbi:hypothetical protein HMPREF9337_01830 [Cutibacterium acnes HL096PA3]|nr:hypothetical protein PAZ_c15500 [Cutibacterium acnes 266]EFS39527.1 hypothetical protein HMPREF9574_00176 [Cutibacterium acnes HL074PA1]EFS46396.1 hypothetical protein HMPREF9580_00811 [Cutibacterium acnes HL087PA2]EFS49328.1 hypothetical protein HMPREF9585_00629 [Cutibacterium acnes HL083PA1]EFS57414.1 hypothetical protein HMPREF9593_00081 [Cutibacterium acnes HL046PA2]EFS59907.1 hypothetical protein HMPREF9604_00169 [Cutibacterium acnes HL036PA1]EFS61286.1 hypothetical protein HMPREF9605
MRRTSGVDWHKVTEVLHLGIPHDPCTWLEKWESGTASLEQ